ncbi:MAG: DNA primase [Solirubrobacteraceae bacterium]
MRYTEDSRDRVRDAVDMVDLVGARVELRRAGANRMEGLCPFHDERTPSFGINPAEKLFYCFGCGQGGDAFKFVELTEGLGFKEALEALAERYGVALEPVEEDPQAAERRRERERLYELLERTATFYVRYLWESGEAAGAREYLAARGLEEATLREFRVGYAPSAWDKVLVASRRAGFSDRELVAAGLASRSDKGQGRTYDRFRRRIMFPLCDGRGRVLGFGARAMGADQKPKYLNSSDNEVFHKGRNLFGADIARVAAAKAGEVIVAEGYTDVIAMHQAGLRNTVGLMGTALTDDQVSELARLAPTVLLALDADSAGQEAMLRAARVAAGRKLSLRVVPLPPGSDPADLAQGQGAEALRRLAGESVAFVRFHVERELAKGDLRDAEGKDAVIAALRPVFATIPPSAMREELVALVADRTDLAPSLVSSWLAQGPVAAPARSRPAAPAAEPAVAAPPVRARQLDGAGRSERTFLAQCLAVPGPGRAALAGMDVDATFSSDLTRRAARHVLARLTGEATSPPLDDEELSDLVAQIVVVSGTKPNSEAALEAERITLELLAVKRALAVGGGDVSALVKRRAELQRRQDAAIARHMDETRPAAR